MPLMLPFRPLALTLLVTGCAAIHRPATTVSALAVVRKSEVTRARVQLDSIIERLARRTVARGDGALDKLYLSGGGQHGAYAAGFLQAWSGNSASPIPTFDLVTGVSTGALQAPLALLGTRAAYDSLAALYREAGDRFPSRIDWRFLIRRTGGVVNTKALARTISTVVDSSMRARLREAAAQDRQLVVSTTDMDLALPRLWSVGDELRAAADASPGIDRILRASAAIPGIFPPVILDGRVHSDGGVAQNFLPLLTRTDWARVAERARALGLTRPMTVRVYAVLNIMPSAPIAVMNPASRGALSSRSTVLLFWQQLPRELETLRTLAAAVSATVPGMTMEFRSLSVPQNAEELPGAGKLFDGPYMRTLLERGAARALSASPWDVRAP
jgi:hypothetical protein